MAASEIEIIEVAPRDGLQNQAIALGAAQRVELVRRLVDAGARRIEVASFVNPRVVPQMADAEAVIAAIPVRADLIRIGLVLNVRGLERALQTGVEEVGVVAVASDTFGLRNQGQTAEQSAEMALEVIARTRQAGRRVQVTIGVAFGCPFEGDVSVARVADMVRRFAAAGALEIAVADTIGVAVPAQIKALLAQVATEAPGTPLRCHFHNTRNTGIANAWAAVESGVTRLDASLGGIGGCPFAPKATGNIATEDLAYMLHRSGLVTGYDLGRLIAAAPWLTDQLGLSEPPSMVSRAGDFIAVAHLGGLTQVA